jgi:hypothetical protein
VNPHQIPGDAQIAEVVEENGRFLGEGQPQDAGFVLTARHTEWDDDRQQDDHESNKPQFVFHRLKLLLKKIEPKVL